MGSRAPCCQNCTGVVKRSGVGAKQRSGSNCQSEGFAPRVEIRTRCLKRMSAVVFERRLIKTILVDVSTLDNVIDFVWHQMRLGFLHFWLLTPLVGIYSFAN